MANQPKRARDYKSWQHPDVAGEDKRQKNALLSRTVNQPAPSGLSTVADLVKQMAGMSIQARNVGQCYEVYREMLADPERPTIFLGLAGPLIAGGLRQVIREMIAFGMVDVVVSTGAILYQDLYQARGYQHFHGHVDADDVRLRELWIDRIYDTYVDEIAFGETDSWIAAFADTLAPGVYSSRQFLHALCGVLADPDSILATCHRRGVPVFSPALNDSSIGIGLTEHHHFLVKENDAGVVINCIQDNYEIAQIVHRSAATAAFYVAGGVPKNYINDAVVMSYIFGNRPDGHRYALQMTTAVVQDGGLSSSTLSEAKTWGKVSKKAHAAMAWVEPTVSLPLVVTAAIQEKLHEGRPRLKFTWDGQLLKGIEEESPVAAD